MPLTTKSISTTPSTTPSNDLTIENVRDILREGLEDDPDIFRVEDDADGNIVVEAIDDSQAKFKIEITAL